MDIKYTRSVKSSYFLKMLLKYPASYNSFLFSSPNSNNHSEIDTKATVPLILVYK